MHTLRDNRLSKVAKRVDMVTNWERRKQITKQQGIFIATSGMLDGGPILQYIKSLGHDIKNSLILTGYQADDSNGRCLLNHGYIMLNEQPFDVWCPVHHLDFSAHAGESALHEVIRQVEPKVVITNHGEPGSCKSLAAYAQSQGCTAVAPPTGESFEVPL
jgi:putative mRNA 3-end processing factor